MMCGCMVECGMVLLVCWCVVCGVVWCVKHMGWGSNGVGVWWSVLWCYLCVGVWCVQHLVWGSNDVWVYGGV